MTPTLDLPIAGVPTVLVFARRRWRRREPLCEVATWSEHVDAVAARSSMTARARRLLAAMVNIDGLSIAAAAVEFGVGWHTAHAAVADYTDPAVDDPARLEGVTWIGVDEKRFLNATETRRTVFTTQIFDLDRHRLLDVIEGRSRDVLAGWLAERGEAWCDQITLATLDGAAGYRSAPIENLANATLVVDHFHAIKLANTAIDDVRRRVQQATAGRCRGCKGDPLYRARQVFLTGFDRLSEQRIAWMFEMLDAGDPDGEVTAAILAKELLREVYTAVDVAHARRRLIGRLGIKWATVPTRRIRGRQSRSVA